MHRSFEAEGAKAGQKAARDQLERVLNEFQKQQVRPCLKNLLIVTGNSC
jgi:hypothetical protein